MTATPNLTPKDQFMVCLVHDITFFEEVRRITGNNEAIAQAISATQLKRSDFYDRWQRSGLDLQDFCRKEGKL